MRLPTGLLDLVIKLMNVCYDGYFPTLISRKMVFLREKTYTYVMKKRPWMVHVNSLAPNCLWQILQVRSRQLGRK